MGWARRRYGNPDQNQQDIVDLVRGHLPASVENTTGVGDGFPDLVVGFQGLTVLVEVKKPERGRGGRKKALQLRDSQEKFVREWRGGPVLAVDEGIDLVQQLIHLDTITPPVRGASDRFTAGTSQAILADCLEAAKGLVVDADDLPALIRKLRGAA